MAEYLTENQLKEKEFFLKHPRKGQKIIAVTSGKSGIGKTWFAIALAHALSLCKQKVLLFDADNGIENISTQLGLEFVAGMEKAIDGEMSLNQVVQNYDKGHFDVITRKVDSANLSELPIGRLHILGNDLCSLVENYDKTILDMNAGIEKEVRILSGMADNIIVLCTAEPSSLIEAYAYIRVMYEQYAKNKFMIVINQVDSVLEGERVFGLIKKACDDFLKIELYLLGVIRRDTRVRDAIKNKVSIISRYPTAEASEDVWSIAKKLVNYG